MDYFIEACGLDKLCGLIELNIHILSYNSLRTLSNVTASNSDNVLYFLGHEQILRTTLKNLDRDVADSACISREACHVMTNAIETLYVDKLYDAISDLVELDDFIVLRLFTDNIRRLHYNMIKIELL